MGIKKIGVDTKYATYEELKQRHVVAQGWSEFGDLTFLLDPSEDIEEYLPRITYGSQGGKNTFNQLFRKIKSGDIILALEGNQIKGIAEIPDKFTYCYDSEFDYSNSLFPVTWVDWNSFCKDVNFMSQGGQGAPGIVDCWLDNINGYINRNWGKFKRENNIDIQPKQCEAQLEALIKNLDERIKETKINYMKALNNDENSKKVEALVNVLISNHNLILTGAPGTGKTYLAKQIAQQMIFGEIKDDMNPNEEKQFDEQCDFVQFHPSYDYTDFVEGLRPVKSVKDDNKNIGFERKDGVFKAFCKNALIKQTANASVTDKLNDNPTVWKVSLAKTGDNAIRKYCMDHGCIRIGWDDYGDIEDFSDYNGFTNGGKNVLNAFQNQMKQGDIIASCWSENEVDAIGVVTGDYEYNDALSDYKRVRKVDWLVKGIKEYIVAINNNKKFTLSTVYMSNITVEDALKIVTKHSTQTINNVNRHFVFIIDEINRGEISKIFGELFFSVDHGYRGEKGRVQTQYQNIVEDGDIFKKGFFVPENVYIIGTMNDIDRSVESMDFAFRRRFAFKEIKAKDTQTMFDDEKAWGKDSTGNYSLRPASEIIKDIKKRMNSLNNTIWDEENKTGLEGLSSAYHIGASYFLKLANYRNESGEYVDKSFTDLWDNHLEGLLREYMRGMQDVETKIDKLKKAYGYPSDSNND